MKKLLISVCLLGALLLVFSCSENPAISSDETENLMEENPVNNRKNYSEKEDSTAEYIQTIPVSIEKEENYFKIGFILSAQIHTIADTKENAQYKDLLEKSIKEESPLNIYLRKNTTEIIKIKSVLDKIEEAQFKAQFKEESKNYRRASSLASVIPNEKKLNDLFNAILNGSCDAEVDFYNCLNFKYPVDGCYARAHKMRQILAYYGYDCEKQFVYGTLRATTGKCCVTWNYHVAILVSYLDKYGRIQKRIIDPSLFANGPVYDYQWRAACANSSCGPVAVTSYANTPGSVYYRHPSGKTFLYDDNYIKTDCVLRSYKPYSGCQSPGSELNISICSR